MWLRTTLLCLCFIILPQLFPCELEKAPIVGIELGQAGFHRDLIYTVNFGYPLAGKNCEYALEQLLPAAIYVSVDQLNDLKRLNKLNVIHPEFVDIEASTENAAAFIAILKGRPKTSDTIKLPIHYRYHAPSSKDSFVDVELTAPTFYIKCFGNDKELIDRELLSSPHITYCLDVEKPIFVTSLNEAPIMEEEAEELDCDWRAMKVNFQLKTSLNAKIPVGNSNALPPVLYATIICSWVISLWTVCRTRIVPRNINEKLEEQRIIENKNK